MPKKHDQAPPTSSAKNMGDCFYGSVTVGERGQVVIPAEARADLNIRPGDKLLIMRHPHIDGLMVTKLEAFREFLDEFNTGFRRVEEQDTEEQER